MAKSAATRNTTVDHSFTANHGKCIYKKIFHALFLTHNKIDKLTNNDDTDA